MKRLAYAILTVVLLSSTVTAQDKNPDAIAQVGDAFFAYYQKSDTTKVMGKAGVLFDNTEPNFPAFKGGQKIRLFLTYEFTGKRLSETPSQVIVAFGSVAGLPARFSSSAERDFRLLINGMEVSRAEATPTSTIPTPYVTYEDFTISISAKEMDRLLDVDASVVMTLGKNRYVVGNESKTAIRNFISTLRLAVGQPLPYLSLK